MRSGCCSSIVIWVVLIPVLLYSQSGYDAERATAGGGFDDIIPALMKKFDIPGAFVALAMNGRIILSAAYGLSAVRFSCLRKYPAALRGFSARDR